MSLIKPARGVSRRYESACDPSRTAYLIRHIAERANPGKPGDAKERVLVRPTSGNGLGEGREADPHKIAALPKLNGGAAFALSRRQP